MYTPRVLFSRLFHQICLFVLSLYNVGRQVTLPCKIRVESLSYVSTVIIESEGKVWSAYIHKVNRIMRLSDDALQSYSHLKFSKMCEWALRLVSWWVTNIHTSYTDLSRYIRNVVREE